jgi:outer membrane protein assembly factor BamB
MTANKLMRGARTSFLIGAALSLSACGMFASDKKEQVYDDEGRERISILSSSQSIEADSAIGRIPVQIPAPYQNSNWAQAGGNGAHDVQHLALGSSLTQAWRADIGRGNQKYERLIAGPVAGGDVVYAVDTKGGVTAVSLSSGRRIWRNDLDISEERSDLGYGGGAALYGDTLYVTSGYGFIIALEADSGRELWRYVGEVPFRGAPTASENRVFAVTHDNQVFAFEAQSGEYLWDQVGIAENAGMLGAASPAYDGTTVVAALSSGELIAMRGTNGRILWQDSLSSSRRLTPLATLTDIDGHPVMSGGKVYAISHAGRMVSIDMRSGERSWEADVAGVSTPWVAGDFGFVTTVDGQVACISLTDGRVRWVSQLQRFVDQEKREGLIKWNGPVLAGDRLIVTSSHGYVLSISPYTGDVLSGIEMPDGASTAPIVVDGKLVVLTDAGDLVAYQ